MNTASCIFTAIWVTMLWSHFDFWASAAGAFPSILTRIGAISAVMCTYLADQIIEAPEDVVNAHCRPSWQTDILRPTLRITTVVCAICCLVEPSLLLKGLIALPFAYVYSKNPEWIGFRVKTLFPMAKNVYVSAIWVGWTFGTMIDESPANPRYFGTVLVYFSIMMLSNIIMDMKDIEGDSKHGIRTLPVMIGGRRCLMVSILALTCIAMLSIVAATENTFQHLRQLSMQSGPSASCWTHCPEASRARDLNLVRVSTRIA